MTAVTEEPAVSTESAILATLQVLAGIQRRFPGWVVWVDGTRRWTATQARPFQSGCPLGPSLLWLHADDHTELVAQMHKRKVDLPAAPNEAG